MQDSQHPKSTDGPDSIATSDLLITRLVDGEATDADREQFDRVATANPALWRDLALRQQDAVLLADRVLDEIAPVDRIDLDAPVVATRRRAGVLGYVGWAAAVVLAVIWGSTALVNDPMPVGDFGPVEREAAILRPEDHLLYYLSAPFVIGELDPILLNSETLEDGRIRVHFMRRIEEVAYLESIDSVPTQDGMVLTVDPQTLRVDEVTESNPH